MSVDYSAMGKHIREYRVRRNLTRRELAEKAGVGYNHIGRIERGVGTPSLAAAIAIANALEVGLDRLIRGDFHYEQNDFVCEVVGLMEGIDKKHRHLFMALCKIVFAAIKDIKDKPG